MQCIGIKTKQKKQQQRNNNRNHYKYHFESGDEAEEKKRRPNVETMHVNILKACIERMRWNGFGVIRDIVLNMRHIRLQRPRSSVQSPLEYH